MTHIAGIFTNFWFILFLLAVYAFVTISACIVVLSENRSPIRSLAWVIALIFLPGIGLIFYLFFGRSLKSLNLLYRHNKRKILRLQKRNLRPLDSTNLSKSHKQLVKLSHSLTHANLTLHNDLQIFTSGKEKFLALIRDLEQARESIYLQYYIFNDDDIGTRIADILIRKAREGLDVKVLYDHVGSFSASNSFFKQMKNNGVLVKPFFRVTFPQLANRINWRNHRKLVIIDNNIGYLGGMNIADRYARDTGEPDSWRDTHFRIQGEIIPQLTASFALDWNFLLKKPVGFPLRTPKYIPDAYLPMQFISSSPTEPWDNMSLIFLKAIASAKKSIYIQTPYFLPTDALLHALEAAALALVDVRIMIPAKPDSRLIRHASFSYISQCIRAGIKVYLYTPGMIHAKAIIIDDDFVTAGSTNFDFRSLENNFECNLLIYSPQANAEMKRIFFRDRESCIKLTASTWQKRPLFNRTLESIIRLFAPIL